MSSTFTRHIYSICVLVFLSTPVLNAQDESDKWILRELLKDSGHKSPIYSIGVGTKGQIFWPKDEVLSEVRGVGIIDNIILNKDGLFIPIDGTGRVYQILSNGESDISFLRIDSTIFSGYNIGAYTFNYKDTIFSLGGYGFWQFNGHLRSFNKVNHEWDIIQLNKKLPITKDFIGIFNDTYHDKIYFQEKKNKSDEGLKEFKAFIPTNPSDSISDIMLFYLDLIPYQ